MKKTTIGFHYPVKPTKPAPVEHSGIADQKGALLLLRNTYMEIKKEIKGSTKVSLHKDSNNSNLSFQSNGFSFSINCTEGVRS